MLYAGLCLNNSQLVVVGLVLFASFCHTFQMLQRLDTYELLMTLPPVPVIPIHKFHADTLNSRQHSELLVGRPCNQLEAVPWQTGLLRLIFIGRSFNQVLQCFTWFDMV